AVHQRHHILELIAETEGASRLIERGAPPETAAQHLVHKPAIEEQVQARMGRTHLDGVQHPIPTLAGSLEGGLDLQRIAIAAEQAVDLVRARGLAQIKEDLDL